MRKTASTAANISRFRSSETGLSTTTTSSGLLEDARTNFELRTAPRDDGEPVTLAILDAALEEDVSTL